MSGMPRNQAESGFTIFELVMVMLVVAILAAIGVPSFKYVTNSNRVATEVNSLLGDMQYARSEAVKEGLPVTVCVSNAGGTGCANSTSWQSGWIVFADSNGDGARGASEAILKAQTAFTSTDTFVADNNTKKITFNRNGYGSTGAAVTVTITLHDATANTRWTRCLAITSVGLLTTEKTSVGNCS